ncbi:MAG: hypothetical protein QF921_17900 [Pseudomonadales bacterium]|nr:hypothetical protein [Pseudomonadales bacterium]MDP6973360.1 hypothetical protein [Pseudomonadales bacterium]
MRQYYEVDIDLVQTSCDYAVPLYDYQDDRDVLTRWSEKRREDGICECWEEKSTVSLDGAPTGILD